MKRFAALFLAAALFLSAAARAADGEDRDAALAEAGRAALAACIDGDMTDVEKITAIHDWLALHCEYDHTPACETAYGAVVEGSASCRGYAEGLAYLADLAGLDGAFTFSEELNHAWILVTLDGSRYFCDCTWDDGKRARMGLVRHAYWLFDESNAGNTNHYGWDSAEEVPGGPLEDAPWREAVTQVIFLEDWAYYIDKYFRLIRCSRDGWETEALLEIYERWPDLDPEDGKTPEIYSGLELIGGRLYFNTPWVVVSVDLEGGDMRTEYMPDPLDPLIYGTAVRDGQLCFSLADAPDELLYDVVETGIMAADAASDEAVSEVPA